jgi:hypothetical protein
MIPLRTANISRRASVASSCRTTSPAMTSAKQPRTITRRTAIAQVSQAIWLRQWLMIKVCKVSIYHMIFSCPIRPPSDRHLICPSHINSTCYACKLIEAAVLATGNIAPAQGWKGSFALFINGLRGASVESRRDAVAVGVGRSCCRRLSPDTGASVRAIAPFPLPAHRTQRADFPHCALRLASRATHGGHS